MFRREDGTEVALEIVGYWTPEYLEEKFRKLRGVRAPNFLVAEDLLHEPKVLIIIVASRCSHVEVCIRAGRGMRLDPVSGPGESSRLAPLRCRRLGKLEPDDSPLEPARHKA